MTIERKCKTCQEKFTIGEDQVKWLQKKGLELFAHCEKCRKARKAANEAAKKGQVQDA